MFLTKKLGAVVAFSLFLTPLWAGTVLVGFKDNAGASVDYDYNDLVFSLSSPTLAVHSAATWQGKPPALTAIGYSWSNGGLLAAPYWNNTSYDGPKENIGWCVYGGGACNNGVGLDPSAEYLATDAASPVGSAEDVSFSSIDPVTVTVLLHIAGSSNHLGWYSPSQPSLTNWIGWGAAAPFSTTFSAPGNFGLIGYNELLGFSFYSQSNVGGKQDSVSHFAYFDFSPATDAGLQSSTAATPEPASFVLVLGAGGVLAGVRRTRRGLSRRLPKLSSKIP